MEIRYGWTPKMNNFEAIFLNWLSTYIVQGDVDLESSLTNWSVLTSTFYIPIWREDGQIKVEPV